MNLHLNMHLDILKKMERYPNDISKIWHTDFCKQDPSATSCKISQTQYLCLKDQF